MNKQAVQQRTEELFRGGQHCAEAVLQAVLESQGVGPAQCSPKVATAFGGGVGRSKKGLCGALSGGLMALGYLRGRSDPEEPWDEIAAMADGLRVRFVARYGCSRCGVVLEGLGPQEKMDKCIRLAGETAGMVYAALLEDATGQTAQNCGCGCSDLHSTPQQPCPAGGCDCK